MLIGAAVALAPAAALAGACPAGKQGVDTSYNDFKIVAANLLDYDPQPHRIDQTGDKQPDAGRAAIAGGVTHAKNRRPASI
jgi:hypothetical protein